MGWKFWGRFGIVLVMKISSENEMVKQGEALAEKIRAGGLLGDVAGAMVIELVGDVGAGKTTFTRGLAEGLGVKEEVTSPSFTISKVYALPVGGRLVHYDFYRLAEPGLMVEDFEENLADSRNVVVIEWGESVAELLPEKHIRVEIMYSDDGGRKLELLPNN